MSISNSELEKLQKVETELTRRARIGQMLGQTPGEPAVQTDVGHPYTMDFLQAIEGVKPGSMMGLQQGDKPVRIKLKGKWILAGEVRESSSS